MALGNSYEILGIMYITYVYKRRYRKLKPCTPIKIIWYYQLYFTN